jgi:ferric-dicitrate binding protein FerR (iron transport regulator)
MTPERLQSLLEAYGAEPRRWPEAERAEALALLQAEPRLRDGAARERRLDALLDRLAAPKATPEFVARIGRTPRRIWVGFAAQAAALAAAAICGLYVGLSSPAPTEQLGDDQWAALLGGWDEG